jgi:hypothetical protein
MATRITNDFMCAEQDGRANATARYSEHAAADGHDAWIVSYRPGRLFTRNQAITAMVLAERLAAGYGDDDPFVIGWRQELGLCRSLPFEALKQATLGGFRLPSDTAAAPAADCRGQLVMRRTPGRAQ